MIRSFEEKCCQLYGMGWIAEFCYLYIVQTLIITVIEIVKQKGDNAITSYIHHVHIILSESESIHMLTELMDRITGCSKEKDGSMHIFNVEH